jgi:hypothetical protein
MMMMASCDPRGGTKGQRPKVPGVGRTTQKPTVIPVKEPSLIGVGFGGDGYSGCSKNPLKEPFIYQTHTKSSGTFGACIHFTSSSKHV